jgi:GT2 family glycosyltransferase
MISIITPVTRPERLAALRESIRQQSVSHPFQHITELDKNREGAAITRNKALKKAKGEYIAFIDDDCIAHKDWLEDLFRYLNENSDVAGVSGLVYPQEDANWIAKANYYKANNDESTSVILSSNSPIEMDHLSCTSSMWRKEVLDKLSGFDVSMKRAQDLDLGLKARKQGYKMMAIKGGIVYHHYPSTIRESIKKSFTQGTGAIHILKNHPEYFGYRRYMIYLSPLYFLLLPVLFPLPLLFCRSGIKAFKRERSLKLSILSTLLEYLKYHTNLAGVWWGIIRCR